MRHEEQPFPGVPTFAWHKMYSEIGKTRTVVTLEGHGGDEIGAGYDYYVGRFSAGYSEKIRHEKE